MFGLMPLVEGRVLYLCRKIQFFLGFFPFFSLAPVVGAEEDGEGRHLSQ
jgi:hypothetical protein